jgi:hypothetical protein
MKRFTVQMTGHSLHCVALFVKFILVYSSGIVFELKFGEKTCKSIPRYILMEGDGDTDKGMKCEWASVKEDYLFVGRLKLTYILNFL